MINYVITPDLNSHVYLVKLTFIPQKSNHILIFLNILNLGIPSLFIPLWINSSVQRHAYHITVFDMIVKVTLH